MKQYMLMINVPHGDAGKVLQAADDEGSTGGTVITGRTVILSDDPAQRIEFEPEMDTVIIMASETVSKPLAARIDKMLSDHAAHSGSLVVVPVNHVIETREAM